MIHMHASLALQLVSGGSCFLFSVCGCVGGGRRGGGGDRCYRRNERVSAMVLQVDIRYATRI